MLMRQESGAPGDRPDRWNRQLNHRDKKERGDRKSRFRTEGLGRRLDERQDEAGLDVYSWGVCVVVRP